MGIQSRYTKKQLNTMSKKDIMKESSYDDMLTDLGVVYNALLLCRESTPHVDQKKALKDQEERMISFIQRHQHIHLLEGGTFIEDGKSGLVAESRPDFLRLIEKAMEKEVDLIIVQEATRFSRNVGEFFTYMQILQNAGVGILILEGEFWTYFMNPSEYPRLAMEVSKGQAESLTTRNRVNRGVETYRERGQLVQGSMFGYDLVKAVERKDNTYKINPVDGATVQKIFDMYVNDGLGTDLIATHLNVNNFPTYDRKSSWNASKVLRVLRNEKYMGYLMYGKYKVIDTNTKKKIATNIEPVRETLYAEDGVTVLEECNLYKGSWEPLVSEDMWWKAYKIRKKRSQEFKNSANGALKTGKRASNDAYANKSYCECGYCLSPQYRHAATETEPAQIAYHCRQQINAHTPSYRKKHGLPPLDGVCSLPAVSDVKMRLMAVKVFEQVFSDINSTVERTLDILQRANEAANSESGVGTLESLKETHRRLSNRLDKLIDMRADGEVSEEQYFSRKENTEAELAQVVRLINNKKLEISEQKKFKMDVEKIRERLNTFVDTSGYGVSDEMMEFFIERIIRRANDEYVWELNLSGLPPKANKYKIKGYDEEYAKSLKDDKNFRIIKTFVISLEECKEFCEKKAHRQYRKKYWNQLTVKIAVK